MKTTRKRYSADFKAKAAREAIDVPPIFSSGLNASFPVVFPLC